MSFRLPLRAAVSASTPASKAARPATRAISSTHLKPADVAPLVGTGPPPEPPAPSTDGKAAGNGPRNAEDAAARVARRKRQSEMLKSAKEARAAFAGSGSKGPTGGLKKRFWKDVTVKEVDGTLQVFLDSRPLRHPATKEIISLPLSKPHLASALAIEWDLLTSAQQATKQHLIPLTSLVCRALDIATDDAAPAKQEPNPSAPFSSSAGADDTTIRAQITTTLLRYLDTDSLLCWAPPPSAADSEFVTRNEAGETLRDAQKRTAGDLVGYLTARAWPGVVIEPVLDGDSIMPRHQSDGVREVVQGWVSGLGPFELAGLERAVLAGKSLVAASRLVVEWSEHDAAGSLRPDSVEHAPETSRFGVEEAAKATSIEVDWQTDKWGEVEDTHDVEKEDLRRQLGSVVLLVSGMGRR